MKQTRTLAAKGKRLLKLLVDEVNSGRIQKHQPATFIPYSEVLLLLGMPDPDIYPGRRLQAEGLNELNEWTKDTPGIPHIAGLIVYKDRHIPGEGFPESHGFKSGGDWNDWWLNEAAKAIDFDWSPYLSPSAKVGSKKVKTRKGPGFDHEELFRSYCLSHGVNTDSTYCSWMNIVADRLNRRLGPANLRSESDILNISADHSLNEFSPKNRATFQSVMRKYIEMVRSNFQGEFDKTVALAIDVDPNELPPRIKTEISRVVRDTAMARKLKRLYDGKCQICCKQLELSTGEFYVEAHHLKPLGKPHNGPDVDGNIICVCPNCHVLLDYGVLTVKSSTLKLKLHNIGKEFVDYHNEHCR